MSKHNFAIQDTYPDEWSHCYGCGRLNENGLHIQSFWDEQNQETFALFTPRPYHTALPGYVYGGLIASLIDCHGTGSAAIAKRQEFIQNHPGEKPPAFRFVTASLRVDFLKPTPLGPPLELRGVISENKGRKVVTRIRLLAEGEITAQGEVIAVQVPDDWSPPSP